MKGDSYRSAGSQGGRVRQAGAASQRSLSMENRAGGMIYAGVVVATYVQLDEDAFPEGTLPGKAAAVYCDVLIYSTSVGQQSTVLSRCLVANSTGMHSGHIWKPRAAKIDISADSLHPNTMDPRNLDGDHVMVQFLDDNLSRPVITGRLPHPRTGLGNDQLVNAGHREQLKVADGDPEFFKHHGTYFGVDDTGSLRFDTTRAHSGMYESDGTETPTEDAQHGNAFWKIANKGEFTVFGLDKDGGNEKFRLQLKDGLLSVKMAGDATKLFEFDTASGKLTVKLGSNDKSLVLDGAGNEMSAKLGGASLDVKNSGGSTLLTVGDGAVSVAIANHLETLYTNLKAQLEQLKTDFGVHSHSVTSVSTIISTAPGSPCTGTLTVPPPTPSTAVFPSWDASIVSGKVKIPDGS